MDKIELPAAEIVPLDAVADSHPYGPADLHRGEVPQMSRPELVHVSARAFAEVTIAKVVAHADVRHAPASVRYEITLTCGCHWWEYRDMRATAPVQGESARCVASHSRLKRELMKTTLQREPTAICGDA